MNESRLDEDLKALSKRPRPNLPTDFNATVWSKVQSRERPSRARSENWLKTLLSALATPQWAVAALGFALLVGWSLGRITTSSVASPTETRLAASVTGEVIDMACYFDDGGSGPDHAACARMCIASGLPVGLKAKDGTIYVLIGKQEPPSPQPAAKHESLNAQLAPYAAKIVTISGTIVSKKGANVIENAELVSEEALWQRSPDRMTDLNKEKRFEAMTALIAGKVGIPVFDIASDAARQSRLQTAIREGGSIGDFAQPSGKCLGVLD